MSEYNIENIEKLRIHELRDFARSMGISSPTTMKKDELISKINDKLVRGEVSAPRGYSGLKKTEEIDFFSLLTSDNPNILNELINQSLSKDNKSSTYIMKKKPLVTGDSNVYYPNAEYYGVSLSLQQESAEYNGEVNISLGYVDIHPSGYGIVRHNGFLPHHLDSYIPKNLVVKHKLKRGQLVQGKTKAIFKNKPEIMFEILLIDDAKEVKKVKDFEQYDYSALGNTLYLDKFDLKINKGSRLYINSATMPEIVKLSYDIIEENAPRLKLINIKARPEDNFPSDGKLEIINCLFNKTEVEIVNAVELVIDRIKREFEYGISNVLVIYNFSELIRIFNVAQEGTYEFNKFNIKAVNKISNLLYLAKNASEKLNVSVICVDKNGVPEDIKNIMNSEFLPLFNVVVDKL